MLKAFALGAVLLGLTVDVGAQCNLLLLGAGKCGAAAGSGVLITALTASWELQEAANTNATDSKNGHTGTQTGGNIGTGLGPADVNAARDFNAGLSQYFSAADHANLDTGDIDFCVESWVRLDSVTGSRGFVVKEGAAGNRDYGLVFNGASERFNFRVSNDGTAQVVIPANVLGLPVINTWYHLIGCHDSVGNQLTLYVNDVTQTAVAHTTGVFIGTSAVHLGAINAANFFDGRKAYSRLYKNLIISAADRTWLYNAGTGRTYAEIQAR